MNIFIYYIPNISNHQFCWPCTCVIALTCTFTKLSSCVKSSETGSSVQPTPRSPCNPSPLEDASHPRLALGRCRFARQVTSSLQWANAWGGVGCHIFLETFCLRMGGHWDKTPFFSEIFVGLIDLKGIISNKSIWCRNRKMMGESSTY